MARLLNKSLLGFLNIIIVANEERKKYDKSTRRENEITWDDFIFILNNHRP